MKQLFSAHKNSDSSYCPSGKPEGMNVVDDVQFCDHETKELSADKPSVIVRENLGMEPWFWHALGP